MYGDQYVADATARLLETLHLHVQRTTPVRPDEVLLVNMKSGPLSGNTFLVFDYQPGGWPLTN
jgi:hypothetical protein